MIKIDRGFDTFVQGTVVQGPLCTRDIGPRRLMSKEKVETSRAVHIIFLSFYKINQYSNKE